jgi:hypothetical protein
VRHDERRQKAQERSVGHLQGLYGVVAALALSIAAEHVIPASGRDVRHLPVVLAFALLFTLVPFYHGALRHLDEQYVVPVSPPTLAWAVLVDFSFLFLESGLLLALAVAVPRPRLFLLVLFILLVVDIVWTQLTGVLAASPAAGTQSGLDAQRSWSGVNLRTCIALVVLGALSH